MNFHKSILYLLFLLIQSNAIGQNYCEKICKKRNIGLFDVAINVPKPTDAAQLKLWTEMHSLSHHYISTIYNVVQGVSGQECLSFVDMSSTFLSGPNSNPNKPSLPWIDPVTGNPLPQEPGGQIDYMIYGEVVPAQNGHFSGRLILLNARRMVVHNGLSVMIDYTGDFGIEGNQLVLELEGGGGMKSLAQIIYEFERKERDDKMNNMAFNPDFLDTEKPKLKLPLKKSYKVKAKEAEVVSFILQDCDGNNLTNRKIKLTANKGKLDKNEIITGSMGEAFFTWTAPDENTDATINLFYKYDLPSDRPLQLDVNIDVKVNKPREEFKAVLTVKAVTVEKQFDADGNIESKTESENNYSVDQTLSFNNVLFERLEKKIQNLEYCNSRGGCVLIQGNSDLFKPTPSEPIGKKNSPVKYSFSSKTYSKCDDKFILSGLSEGDGSTSDYMVTTMVSIYKYSKADEDFQPVPLVKNKADMDEITPVPLTNANHFAQLSFQLGYFNPSPGNATLKKYDCSTKEWQNSNEKSGGPSGEFIERGRPSNQNGLLTYFVNPVIPEIELMNYLRNPIGEKKFIIRARRYIKEANTETQTDFYITLLLH